MQICKHLKAFSGGGLYECEVKNIRLGGLDAPICLECKNYEPDLSQMPAKFLYLDWCGAHESNVFSCYWRILASDDIMTKGDIDKIKNWVDRKVKNSGKITFVKTGKNMYDLEISGKGKDNRCRWCASFRTALKTANLVKQKSDCGVDWSRLQDLARKGLIDLDEGESPDEYREFDEDRDMFDDAPYGFEEFEYPADDQTIYDDDNYYEVEDDDSDDDK